MPLPVIVPIVASLASSGYGLYNKYQADKEQEAYAKKRKSQEEREMRRQALLRAIGANLGTKPVEFEIAPDLSKYAIRSGLADIGSTLFSSLAGGSKRTGA
jgi:hypothetical protein